MKTIIVPVDFSDNSKSAANYAVKLFTGHEGIEIILYHTYSKSSEAEDANRQLEEWKTELSHNRQIRINTLAEGGDFLEELEKLARHRIADLIVMGITGRSALAQVFVGSNALKMAENKFCPVMIIPKNAEFREIKHVMLTSDFKNVVSTTPTVPIKKILDIFNADLYVVNVNTDLYIALSEENEAEKQKLKEMFAEYNPEFYFMRLFDIQEAIRLFAEDRHIDLIINVKKEKSLVHRLFQESQTKKLATESHIPVMIVHE